MSKVLTSHLKQSGLGHFSAEGIQKILSLALTNGGALAELFFEDTLSTRVIYEGGKVEKILDGGDRGCGIRILFDHRSVYGYTTDLSEETLCQLAQQLAQGVTQGEEQGRKTASSFDSMEWTESKNSSKEMSQYQIQKSPRKITLQEKVAYVQRADQKAYQVLPQARQVTSVFIDALRKILILNSDGLISRDEKTYLHMIVQVVGGKEGRVESAHESQGGYVGLEFFEKTTPEQIASEAARRVSVLLDAQPAPSGSMPVVLSSEAGGTMIHEAVGHGLEADLACNGLSVYQGKVGQQVASPLITVLDDGSMPGLRGSYEFDDEGTPSQKNVLIEKGILKGYLVDRLSAMKFDLPATGNGRRESFRCKPIVRMTNTYIVPGTDDPEQILKDTKKGIFVKAMGGGEVDTVTGDFIFAVTEGYLIQDGKLGAAIRGATLVGNGPQVMKKVDRVGTDLGFATGTCGKDGQGAPVTDAQPTIRIPEITVGGEVPMSHYWK